MNKVTFDTDVLIWYFRGNIKVKEFLENFRFEDRIILAPVYFELIQGCKSKLELKNVKKFIMRNFCGLEFPNQFDFQRALKILESYSLSHGTKSWDALISAMVINRKWRLASANVKHYNMIKGLKLIEFQI